MPSGRLNMIKYLQKINYFKISLLAWTAGAMCFYLNSEITTKNFQTRLFHAYLFTNRLNYSEHRISKPFGRKGVDRRNFCNFQAKNLKISLKMPNFSRAFGYKNYGSS